MARPCRQRRIKHFPDYWTFSVADNENRQEEIIMSLDEYETIRLIDHEGKTQVECALSMDVARTTVTAIYDSARKKLSRMIVEGNPVRISGGIYRLSSDRNHTIEGKDYNMNRIAVTYENGMIGQHFGHTEEFKLYDVEAGKIVQEQVISTNGEGHGMLAGVLKEAQVDLLICGGIGMGARMALEEAGIGLIPGTQGTADEVVNACLDGTLEYDPGEICHHHDHEGGHDCDHEQGCENHCHNA
ncbi:MAG: DUF134 domain-containing protein [Erysipelotrichaceae bacterium]|nr:DUF134 domain-containing protein [Erysipelotrichaceae bacterium]